MTQVYEGHWNFLLTISMICTSSKIKLKVRLYSNLIYTYLIIIINKSYIKLFLSKKVDKLYKYFSRNY